MIRDLGLAWMREGRKISSMLHPLHMNILGRQGHLKYLSMDLTQLGPTARRKVVVSTTGNSAHCLGRQIQLTVHIIPLVLAIVPLQQEIGLKETLYRHLEK